MCQSGRQNLCENLQFFGCGWDQGGMAYWFTVACDRLHGVPDDLDDQTAALIEPLSTPVHAVRLACDAFGARPARVARKAVPVLGPGPIGLPALALLPAHGARPVAAT